MDGDGYEEAPGAGQEPQGLSARGVRSAIRRWTRSRRPTAPSSAPSAG